MILAWNNYFDQASLLTPSSEKTGYPILNAINIQLAKIWRMESDSAEEVVIDLGTAKEVSFVGIAGHNLSSSADVRLQGNSSDSWGSPPFEVVIPAGESIMFKKFALTSYRYWRLYLDDPTNVTTYLYIGRIFLGPVQQFTYQFSSEFAIELLDSSVVQYSISGQLFGDDGIIARRVPLTFPYVTNQERKDIRISYEAVKKTKPVFVIPAELIPTDLEPCYCSFENEPRFQHIANIAQWSCTMTFREAF